MTAVARQLHEVKMACLRRRKSISQSEALERCKKSKIEQYFRVARVLHTLT